MPIFKVNAVENKSNDWKIISITSEQGVVLTGVSVNRVNKKNETFPAFDQIVEGKEVDGNLWTSGAGKNYLFAPDIKKTYNTFQKAGPKAVEKAMDRKESFIERSQVSKEESIQKAQDNKEHSIMVASTASQATQILTALVGTDKINVEDWKEDWLNIRYWLASKWNQTEPQKVGTTDIIYPENTSDIDNFGPF